MIRSAAIVSRSLRCVAVAILLGGGMVGAAQAETVAERVNRGLVELLTAGDPASIEMAQELAVVIDDGATRRLLPVVGHDATAGLLDLNALRGVDMAIAQTDVIDDARQRGGPPNMDVVTYIAKLYNEELHVLARADVARIEDLAGKKVDFVGGARVTGPVVLGLLNIKVESVFDDRGEAVRKVAAGELAAVVYVAAKPTPLFAMLPGEGLHFLAVPMTPALANAYVPAQLTATDYPRLVAGAPVDTIAVGTALMVANLQPKTERYRNLANFVDAFFTQFPRLQEAPRHPKWREVNLTAELPGWKRFAPADAWLKRNAVAAAPPIDDKELHEIFAKFLDQRSKLAGGRALSAQEKDQLFDQFQRWQQSSSAR
jgi:TRAP-type uncharacterized transport system substrate-binding protein